MGYWKLYFMYMEHGVLQTRCTCYKRSDLQRFVPNNHHTPLLEEEGLYSTAWELGPIGIRRGHNNDYNIPFNSHNQLFRVKSFDENIYVFVFAFIVNLYMYIYIYIRLKIKPNSVRIRFLELSTFCSSLDGIWTHTIDTLQHHSLSLTSSALCHSTSSTPLKGSFNNPSVTFSRKANLGIDVRHVYKRV